MKPHDHDEAMVPAFEDLEFLRRDELRPTRLMLEHLKPELFLRSAGIRSTIVVFGSARIIEPALAAARLDETKRLRDRRPGDPASERLVRIAERLVLSSKYYETAREFGKIVSTESDHVVMTGGGPGVMEATNRGARDAGAKSVGLNIELPHEQSPNPYITRGLSFNFHYFAMRKMHFMLRAKALVAFPGGFGTMDELFEALTLVQTGKVAHLPVILVGRSFWEKAIDFDLLVDEGLIAPEDVLLFRFAETAKEAWEHIVAYYAKYGDE
ncbi:MAG TPA: TIGR00730 family Rossman fold protein [Candidatus Polarisedimenticolaceae bacterium]|nr:TIGR00730 family Rossman fold protein [Candidatus Polarisedimenticolaceae bacterium]